MSNIGHRPDIQGLRALCILSVVLFHAQTPGFAGGFVGVDVFFVISGFLIGGLLIDEMSKTGTVNLTNFFARRIRRLLPNATVTILVTLVLATWLLPAYTRNDLASDSLASSLFYINFRLSTNLVNYFQHNDPVSPFMHFWSLAIEEQYYFVFPMVLLLFSYIFTWRLQSFVILIASVFLLSFTQNLFVVSENQPAAFFRTDTRCWQLAAGVLVALGMRIYGPLPTFFRVLGLSLVLGSIVLIADDAGYPGYWALLPTLGGVLIVWALPSAENVGLSHFDLLTFKVMQWLGARSYSWYLWHWPILVFANTAFGSSALVRMGAVLGSLGIAHFMFTVIENPVRRGIGLRANSMYVFGAGAICILCTVGAGTLYKKIPWNPRVDEWTQLVIKSSVDFPPSFLDKCHTDEDTTAQKECVYGDKAGRKLAVIFGDSHASQWLPAIDAAAAPNGWRINSWSKTGCPSVDVTMWFVPRKAVYQNCDRWRSQNLESLKRSQKPDLVIIANRIDYSGWIFDQERKIILEGEEADKAWAEGLERTLLELEKLNVPIVVIRDTPPHT